MNAEGVHHDYIVGDITSPSASSSDHLYFTVEGDSCQLQCVVFSFRRDGLSDEPNDEMRALLRGDLEYYADRGQMSLRVTDCHEIGEGSYSQVYQQTKSQLESEGLFDDEHKQPMPQLPQTIGLVTSKHGDAVDDAIESIHSRHPGIDIEVAHATVQGDNAVESLTPRIANLDQDPSIDLIVVTRGGGADSTLRTFNELPVCRAVARTNTPIAAGIGHETDEALADRVADERIMTPTDAGSLVPDRTVLKDRCDQLTHRVEATCGSLVKSKLAGLSDSHQNGYVQLTKTKLRQLDGDLAQTTKHAMETRLHARSNTLEEAYTSSIETRLATADSQLTAALRRHNETRLYDLNAQLEQAYATFEREREYKTQIEAAKSEAKAEATQEVATRERAYQAALVVLILLLLGVLGVTFVL
ncbi:MAG: exodeoxyribonuclease VII, large subunit [halophilic archaeon J07HX5]|nr:MAG: exodeoxyribonuclease VII, large subunit [halophilic archaeon J07HX5]